MKIISSFRSLQEVHLEGPAMGKYSDTYLQHQKKVNSYFQSLSSHWRDVYTNNDVKAEIIRDRHAAVLSWVESLALAPGSRVLEVGCGAGFLAIALAQRGLHVHAIDSTESMIEQARQNATQSEVGELLTLDVGNVYSLAFQDESFDLVIAIGVIPWLKQAELAIREMGRVATRGGYVIFTTANLSGLASLLDPWINPFLVPLKRFVKRQLERLGFPSSSPTMIFHSNRFIDKTLRGVGLVKIQAMTRGFGFSLNHKTLPPPLGTTLHHFLQRLADQNVPGVRSTGMAYFVMARKPLS
jgi:ubiquinone/menaquinone biosynthesis C-methylase UbiE